MATINNQKTSTFNAWLQHMPRQGFSHFSKRPEEFLLVCYYDHSGITLASGIIALMQAQLQFSITVLNLFEHNKNSSLLTISTPLNINRFAGIIIHSSAVNSIDNLRSFDKLFNCRLKDFLGAKILLKQTENHQFKKFNDYIKETHFDIVFTCLPECEIKKHYQHDDFSNTKFVQMLNAYVMPQLRIINYIQPNRKIDIGYRGSIKPLYFGRAAFEALKIGDDVSRLLKDRGLSLDISNSCNNRYCINKLIEFLASCTTTLGTESGASIFDLDGGLDQRCRLIEEKLGQFREDRNYAEAYLGDLADLEDRVQYRLISIRHFIAAATGTVQLLYPGKYSGILLPERHYFALKRDYSNLDDAIELIRDKQRRAHISQAIYEEVIQNKDLWIETFVKDMDILIYEVLEAKNLFRKPLISGSMKRARNVLLIAAHEPSLDPRLKWIESAAPPEILIHQIGVLPPNSNSKNFAYSERGSLILTYPRIQYKKDYCEKWYSYVSGNDGGIAAIYELNFIEYLLRLPTYRFREIFNAPFCFERISKFKWYLWYILNTSSTLIKAAQKMRGLHAVIATDLDTLPAGLVIKGMYNIPLFYDAHEYWPDADLESYEYEKQYWKDMECRLVAHANYRQTVSKGLAEFMSEQYGCAFNCLPNAEPKRNAIAFEMKASTSKETCKFLFQGGFAIGRGIDLLIKAWPYTNKDSILLLRGPDNGYKRDMKLLADSIGLLGTRIFFPEPVDESQLISAASEADVGLIPYSPVGMNHKFCCPNKLSQFMAAGLPILANSTMYVNEILRKSGCGRSIDFSESSLLIQAIKDLSSSPVDRYSLGQNGLQYFLNTFNWENVSIDFYKEIENCLMERLPESLCLYEFFDGSYLKTPILKKVTVSLFFSIKNLHYSFISISKGLWHALPMRWRVWLGPILLRFLKRLNNFFS
jgi:glycosyltransferase involved in cell wall biosynthesis